MRELRKINASLDRIAFFCYTMLTLELKQVLPLFCSHYGGDSFDCSTEKKDRLEENPE